MNSLKLPDEKIFNLWDDSTEYIKTYHVKQLAPEASDNNVGSYEHPFKTIQAAAEILKPGEKVVIHEGVYREHVAPACGGLSSKEMIHYQAAPGEKVTISGTEIYSGNWKTLEDWNPYRGDHSEEKELFNALKENIWQIKLQKELFIGYMPFSTINAPQFHSNTDDYNKLLSKKYYSKLMLKRGMLFQDGRRLTQVRRIKDLESQQGVFWTDSNGLDLCVRPFSDSNPYKSQWEVTTREQAFAPEKKGNDYIRVSGISITGVADGFTWPQRAALSVSQGAHWIIEDCCISEINANGMDLGGQSPLTPETGQHGYHIIRRNIINNCGLSGICGTAISMNEMLVEDNHIIGCGWQNVEAMWESASIKMHWTKDSIFKNNYIYKSSNAAGIWLDFGITNTRITGNRIIDTLSGFGGIFIEAAKTETVMIDHNIISGSRMVEPFEAAEGASKVNGGNGIYQHDSDKVLIVNNMIHNCEGAAVCVNLGVPDRIAVNGRGAICYGNIVKDNVISSSDKGVYFGRPENIADGNKYFLMKSMTGWQTGEPLEYLDWEAWREFRGHDHNGELYHDELSFEYNAGAMEIRSYDRKLLLECIENTIPDALNDINTIRSNQSDVYSVKIALKNQAQIINISEETLTVEQMYGT